MALPAVTVFVTPPWRRAGRRRPRAAGVAASTVRIAPMRHSEQGAKQGRYRPPRGLNANANRRSAHSLLRRAADAEMQKCSTGGDADSFMKRKTRVQRVAIHIVLRRLVGNLARLYIAPTRAAPPRGASEIDSNDTPVLTSGTQQPEHTQAPLDSIAGLYLKMVPKGRRSATQHGDGEQRSPAAKRRVN